MAEKFKIHKIQSVKNVKKAKLEVLVIQIKNGRNEKKTVTKKKN